MPSLLNRADLLVCFERAAEAELVKFAAVFGYRFEVQPQVTNKSELRASQQVTASIKAELSGFSAPEKELPQASYLRVVSHRRINDTETADEAPAWFRDAKPYTDNDPELQAPKLPPPPQPALMNWNRLWPFLKLALGARLDSHIPDMRQAVTRVAKGEVLKKLPKSLHKTWAHRAQLIIDYDPSLTPFWQDFNDLRRRLGELRGEFGLEIWAFPDGDPGGACWLDRAGAWREQERYRPPPPGSPVLILGDAGCNAAAEQRRQRWRRFGRQLAQAACRAVVLAPCPAADWDAEQRELFMFVQWDRAVRPPHGLRRHAAGGGENRNRDDGGAELLLALLATAVRVEPALLRAARYLFPPAAMHVGAEYAAWNHPAMARTPMACYFQPARVVEYRRRFREQPELTLRKKRQIGQLQQAYHAHLSPAISYEEQMAHADLLGQDCPEAARNYSEKLAVTVTDPRSAIGRGVKQWLGRAGGRQHAGVWEKNPALAAAWLKAHFVEDLDSLVLPEGMKIEDLMWVLKSGPLREYRIYQRGLHLYFQPASETYTGSFLGTITSAKSAVAVSTKNDDSLVVTGVYDFAQGILIESGRLIVRSEREELQLDCVHKPAWANSMGRDNFGLYADLTVNTIIQRFRWINPGTFLMGSPETEAERYDDETQHQVTLSQGYWLAVTACTQTLWLAVMGANPSRFNENGNNPVEQVSWNDVQDFIMKLKAMFPDLAARLPTEAEWEYACRAGTVTTFLFGENITPEQVNYWGDVPYKNGPKGLNRQKTVPVKSLQANPWGLHEMHGNVWEWCQDWFGDYGQVAITDPAGPENGSLRVLRGGSWNAGGRDVRSACRSRRGPDHRALRIGFRLALGRGASE